MQFHRNPIRLIAGACMAAALACGAAPVLAQGGIGGSSPTAGSTARGESGDPKAPLVQKDSGNKAATNGMARLERKRHHAARRHHRKHHPMAAAPAAPAAPRAPVAGAAPVMPPAVAPVPAPMAGTAVQTQSGRVDATGQAPKTGQSPTPATPAMPGK